MTERKLSVSEEKNVLLETLSLAKGIKIRVRK
jgi:hypothetical protein